MTEPQAPSGAQSLNQINAEFATARASRLDAALQSALAMKLPPEAKPGAAKPSGAAKPAKPTAGSPGPASAASPKPSSAPPSSGSAGIPGADTAASTSSDPSSTEESTPDSDTASSESPSTEGDLPEPTEVPETEGAAVNGAELLPLAKKKDLRAIEKAMGWPEGILGATNGEHAAVRRRQDEVARAAQEVAETHYQNNEKLIRKFGPTAELFAAGAKGDLAALGHTIERATGMSIAAFIEHWTKNIRHVPAQELEARRRLLQYENPDGTPRSAAAPPAAAQEPAAAPKQDVSATAAKVDAYIAQEAKGHAALKLANGAELARQKYVQSFVRGKGFSLTPQQACDAVVSERRRALEQESWLLAGKKPAPAPRTRTINRRDAANAQPRTETRQLSRNELIEQGANMIRRQKAADAARAHRR